MARRGPAYAQPEARAEGLTGLGAERLVRGPWRIVITGAGGWLGLATLELLHGLLGDEFPHRVVGFGSAARVLNLRSGVSVAQHPLDAIATLEPAPSLVLHLACLTQEKAGVMTEADYLAANRAISAKVLGALDPIGAEGVFLPSSGAAYMVGSPDKPSSMRLYGGSKLEDEQAFTDWAARRGRSAAVARVFNVSGPYINKTSSYALACFIADALAGRPIEIRADRQVFRSYVAIRELMSVVLGVVTDPSGGIERFDTAGEEVLEMEDIATAVAAALDHGLGLRRPPLSDVAADRYNGDGETYRRLRHRYGVEPVRFEQQVAETARFMAGVSGEERG